MCSGYRCVPTKYCPQRLWASGCTCAGMHDVQSDLVSLGPLSHDGDLIGQTTQLVRSTFEQGCPMFSELFDIDRSERGTKRPTEVLAKIRHLVGSSECQERNALKSQKRGRSGSAC